VPTAEALERLLAEQDIRAACNRYCFAVDHIDLELLRGCFHSDAVVHYGGFDGGVDGLVAMLGGLLPRFAVRMHNLANHLATVTGVTATAESYAVAVILGDPVAPEVASTVHGLRYVDRFERRRDEWRIVERWAITEWTADASALSVAPRREAPRA
jgi:hypothetical protein